MFKRQYENNEQIVKALFPGRSYWRVYWLDKKMHNRRIVLKVQRSN